MRWGCKGFTSIASERATSSSFVDERLENMEEARVGVVWSSVFISASHGPYMALCIKGRSTPGVST